ncbi:hypothetical protein WBG78_17990 [Chryseolinea sp. T2]|uniref:hypothetical protein n=1 Tax=Chryseolinea sp. T2 TaxID=3129255 RepID=UPI0030784606
MTVVERIHILSNEGRHAQLVDYVGDNEKYFKALISMYIGGPYRITQRLSGPVTSICIRHPFLLKPYFALLLKALNDNAAPLALKRSTIRMFQFVPIPKNSHGKLLDICFRFLLDKRETIAVKVFSMSVAECLVRYSDELCRELRIVIEDQLPYSGPAFRSRATKVLKRLLKESTPASTRKNH